MKAFHRSADAVRGPNFYGAALAVALAAMAPALAADSLTGPLVLKAQCSCSRDAVAAMLKSFSPDDRSAMVKDDKVVVTCEFCSSVYEFTPQEAGVEDA